MECAKLRKMLADHEDDDSINVRLTWQYFDAMDILYCKAKQKLLDERRKKTIQVQVSRLTTNASDNSVNWLQCYNDSNCHQPFYHSLQPFKPEQTDLDDTKDGDDDTDRNSDASSMRTLSLDSTEFEQASALSIDEDDALTQSDQIHSNRPVLQRATSTVGQDNQTIEAVSAKRKASQELNHLHGNDMVPQPKRRRVDTTGSLIGQHVASSLDSFATFPEFQAHVIKQIQDIMTKASYDFFDLAKSNVDDMSDTEAC